MKITGVWNDLRSNEVRGKHGDLVREVSVAVTRLLILLS